MTTLQPPVGPGDHITGSSDPVLTICEYGDYQCPYCGEAYPMVKMLMAEHGDRVRLAFRNFPLTDMHPQAMNAAVVAEFCGEKGKFWEAHDLLYEHQAELGDELYSRIITELGLSLDEAQQAIESGRLVPLVQKQLYEGIRSGVNGTPCFFLNGNRLDSPGGWGDLPQAVEQFLADA